MENKDLEKIITAVKIKYCNCENKCIKKYIGKKLAGDIKWKLKRGSYIQYKQARVRIREAELLKSHREMLTRVGIMCY